MSGKRKATSKRNQDQMSNRVHRIGISECRKQFSQMPDKLGDDSIAIVSKGKSKTPVIAMIPYEMYKTLVRNHLSPESKLFQVLTSSLESEE